MAQDTHATNKKRGYTNEELVSQQLSCIVSAREKLTLDKIRQRRPQFLAIALLPA